jgi:hypothetical protein
MAEERKKFEKKVQKKVQKKSSKKSWKKCLKKSLLKKFENITNCRREGGREGGELSLLMAAGKNMAVTRINLLHKIWCNIQKNYHMMTT